jgi:hypothetical protein
MRVPLALLWNSTTDGFVMTFHGPYYGVSPALLRGTNDPATRYLQPCYDNTDPDMRYYWPRCEVTLLQLWSTSNGTTRPDRDSYDLLGGRTGPAKMHPWPWAEVAYYWPCSCVAGYGTFRNPGSRTTSIPSWLQITADLSDPATCRPRSAWLPRYPHRSLDSRPSTWAIFRL